MPKTEYIKRKSIKREPTLARAGKVIRKVEKITLIDLFRRNILKILPNLKALSRVDVLLKLMMFRF
jgi:hypothetical protein